MSRSRHVALEQGETVVVTGRSVTGRRAALEHELAAALADGDREMVSRVRGELGLLDAHTASQRPRRAAR